MSCECDPCDLNRGMCAECAIPKPKSSGISVDWVQKLEERVLNLERGPSLDDLAVIKDRLDYLETVIARQKEFVEKWLERLGPYK